RRKLVDLLGAETVKPGQPVGPGDLEHVPVRTVHQSGRVGQRALLAERVAIVGRNADVGEFRGDGIWGCEQRAVHAPRLPLPFGGSGGSSPWGLTQNFPVLD